MQDNNNNSKEAEILGQLAKELGVSGWNDNIKQVQQMVEMEERDIKESESLGGIRVAMRLRDDNYYSNF